MARHSLRRRYGRARKRELSVFDKHQLKIAQQTLRMPDAMVAVMGGMSKEDAARIVRELTAKKYGYTRRKYGVGDASGTGRQRLLKGWVVYRGYTLDPWKGAKIQHSKATWEVRVHKGSGPGSMEGNAFGETLDEAMNKAKRLVDAMHGD